MSLKSPTKKSTIHQEGDNLFFKFDCSIDESKRGHFEFWFINLGLLSCYVVCGLIIAALGASIQDVAENVNRKSTDIASIFVARGIGSIFGSFVSAPIFTEFNAIKSLMVSYVVTVVVLLWIPFISSLMQLHVAYFIIGSLTSIISSGSILLLRKIHMDKAGPWLGALGAALVSAGMIVPLVQMLVGTMMAQFCLYSAIIAMGALWLRMLPCMRQDVYASYGDEGGEGVFGKISHMLLGDRGSPDLSLSPRISGRQREKVQKQQQQRQKSQSMPLLSSASSEPKLRSLDVSELEVKSPFFMTPVAAASNSSSSCYYTSSVKDLSKFSNSNSHNDLATMAAKCHIGDKQQHRSYQSLEAGEGADCATSEEDEELLFEALLTEDPPHYYTDLIISVMILFIIGGSNAFSIYIETYVDDTGVIASQWKAMVLMLFFGTGTFSNVIGIFIQMDIGDKRLAQVTAVVLAGGALGMMLIIGRPRDSSALWAGVALYGFASAVTVGFCFNIANRLSYPSAKSTSIIMMGSSIGVSLIPYLASLLYKWSHAPLTMMYIALVSMVVPMALLYLAPKFSYLGHVHKF